MHNWRNWQPLHKANCSWTLNSSHPVTLQICSGLLSSVTGLVKFFGNLRSQVFTKVFCQFVCYFVCLFVKYAVKVCLQSVGGSLLLHKGASWVGAAAGQRPTIICFTNTQPAAARGRKAPLSWPLHPASTFSSCFHFM